MSQKGEIISQDSDFLSRGEESLSVIYKNELNMDCADLLLVICSILKEEGLLFEKYWIKNNLKTIGQIEKFLNNRQIFLIWNEILAICCNSLYDRGFQQLNIEKIKNVKVNWDQWIHKLVNAGMFVYAWQYDVKYCELVGEQYSKMCKHFCCLYENLSPEECGIEYEMWEIDTDILQNPGRMVLTTGGYIETVGSTMWLGDEFFILTGANKEAVKSADWLQVSEFEPGILKIKAQELDFTQSKGKEANLQNRMRNLLYPRHE